MVLFKRKPVQYLSRPEIENDETEVWQIPQTEEIFVDYDAYLNRMEFYKHRRFICQITGHSGLTFFEALKSELAGAQEVEEAFPEALKGPILRRVQFQTISRIDTLVDLIYEEFRADYYPGEAVTVHVVTGERLTGVVRDKSRFGAKVQPDGTTHPPFSRYFVHLDNRPTEEAVVDDAHITRDRKIFTKQVLRSFIKKTVTREAWTGAPWLVRKDVAEQYHIDQRIPPHLRYESKAAERKQKQAQQKSTPLGPDYEGMIGSFPGNGPGGRFPELKPAPKSHKSKQQQGHSKTKQQPFLNPAPMYPHPSPYPPQQPLPHFVSHNFQPHNPHHPPPGPQFATFTHNGHFFAPLASMPPAPPPPPPIKYPIEDLQVMPRNEPQKRPEMKYFSQDNPMDGGKSKVDGNGILMKSVGPLLESWDTLNVYCEVFKLDSFTFDDFVEAMQFTSEDVECELFVEAHCAALKMLVSSEADGGKIHVQLPEMDDEDDDEDEEDESAVPTPTPEPEPQPTGRATRASLAKAEAAALKAEAEAVPEPTPEPKSTHRAAELQLEYNWIDQLRKRDFKNGGWQVIIVGLLYQLSKNPRSFEACETLLRELAPLDLEPTMETVRSQYAQLDVNFRIQALQILCMLTTQTKAVRNFIEECSEQMTSFRKEKIQYQRDRKAFLEDLRLLNEERKALLPANAPPSPAPENKNLDVNMPDVEEDVQDSVEDDNMDTDDDPPQVRSLRRGMDRAADRKRKREAEQEKKDKAEAEAKLPKQSKQFTKLLKDIQKKEDLIKECEEEIAVLDNDLREADCPRTRVLGKDRFWNRYYWFERNGMPYAGLPNSSTADIGYANGCVWVQGPDELEREGYINMKPEWENEYQMRFNITVPQRKKIEEGPTSVFNATQWGYYEDPESIDGLLAWLDTRGINEIKLHKELKLYRDRIVKHMEIRKRHLVNPAPASSEEEPKAIAENTSKRSSRKKEQVTSTQTTDLTTTPRCLAWRNDIAMEVLGHLHSDQPRARKPSKKSMLAAEKEKERTIVVEEEKGVSTRGKKEKKGGGRN